MIDDSSTMTHWQWATYKNVVTVISCPTLVVDGFVIKVILAYSEARTLAIRVEWWRQSTLADTRTSFLHFNLSNLCSLVRPGRTSLLSLLKMLKCHLSISIWIHLRPLQPRSRNSSYKSQLDMEIIIVVPAATDQLYHMAPNSFPWYVGNKVLALGPCFEQILQGPDNCGYTSRHSYVILSIICNCIWSFPPRHLFLR